MYLYYAFKYILRIRTCMETFCEGRPTIPLLNTAKEAR